MALAEEEIIFASNDTVLEEDIYFDYVETTGPTLRTVPDPPDHYHPIVKALHHYFLSLFYELEAFFMQHWGYFLIGFGLFILFVIIPGIVTQIYCDRLYRKFKREQITRKILEYEAQMEKDSEASDDDDFKRATCRAKKDYSSDSVSEVSAESPRRIKGRRGRSKSRTRSKSQGRQKTGKKVRSRSRPKRKHRAQSSDESVDTVSMKHEVQVKFNAKKAVKESKESKMKKEPSCDSGTGKMKSTGVDPLPLYTDHVSKEKRFEDQRKQRDSGVSMWDAESNSDYYSEPTGKFTNRYNDQPPAYASDNAPNSAAVQAVAQFPTLTISHESDILDEKFTMPDTSLPVEPISMPFLAARATGIQAMLPMAHQVHRIKEEPMKPNDHRVGYWSAGIVSQYNGARTPPLPAKMYKPSKAEMQNLAAIQGATPITYEEIRMMKQHQIHDSKKQARSKAPADYNSALLSISQANDDILHVHHQKTGPIIPNLMPIPEPREPLANPPALPPKSKNGIKTVSRCPSMDLNRTMHNDGIPTNLFDGEVIDHEVTNIKPIELDKNTRTKSITSKQTIRDIVKDINKQQAFSPELADTSQSESESSAVTNQPASSVATTAQTSVVFPATDDDSMFDAITPMTQMSLSMSPVSNRTVASNKTAKTIVNQNQEDTQSGITSDDNTNVSQ